MKEQLVITESGAWDFDIAESGAWDFDLTEQVCDETGPIVTSAEVGLQTANVLDIYFDEAIYIENEPELTDFTFDFSGGEVTAESIIFDQGGINTHVVLTLSRAIEYGETGEVTYSGTAIKDVWGNSAAGFTQTITNNVT